MVTKSDFKDIKWVLSEHGEFPSFYSETACKMIAAKYFAKGETSMMDLVSRIAVTIAASGQEQGYFDDVGEEVTFARALGGGMLRQEFMFNSPVLFNVGVEEEPQCSACFIQGVDDTMESILSLSMKEGLLFKYGSGTGTNFSRLRGAGAALSSGGTSSGVPEFMKGYDAFAGVIKSGGKTRRAAKMVILDHDHPDIDEFIRCKADEEKLMHEGLPKERAMFQNGNNTVRVSDEFMKLATVDVLEDISAVPAHTRLMDMAQAAWECGDPGIQFTDTINDAMPNGLECRASNPCGEFMFIDDSACNLASINLAKIAPTSPAFYNVVHLLIKAMDILVDMSSYPSTAIEENSRDYRPLGLGYTNLGTYLMKHGIPYGSQSAQDEVSSITCTMQGYAREASAALADRLGNYKGGTIRNAQLTLLAPTGTISFAMDCESFGIEPVYSEEIHKQLEGGGTVVSVPQCIKDAEARKDYDAIKVALSTDKARMVTPLAHIKMMAAAQPHLSGAISKTVNMPNDCTVQDIYDIYVEAWKLGLKGIAVYRDGSKAEQVLTTKPLTELSLEDAIDEFNVLLEDQGVVMDKSKLFGVVPMAGEKPDDRIVGISPQRQKLPSTRSSVTHKVSIAGLSTYVTIGLFEDGTPGEVFISMSKVGSSVRGWADSWATLLSIALQNGVPLDKLIKKFRGTKFEPAGFTGREDVKYVDSVVDCVMQLLAGMVVVADSSQPSEDIGDSKEEEEVTTLKCSECGGTMAPTGSCHTCLSCGETLGGCS